MRRSFLSSFAIKEAEHPLVTRMNAINNNNKEVTLLIFIVNKGTFKESCRNGVF